MQRKFLISGGGTGGHIFPAVAIAQLLQKEYSGCEILFVGASNRMEMEKVPQEGYKIIGLDVMGLKRAISPMNIVVLWKFIKAYFKSKKIVKEFNPDCVIGTGGYASLAVLYAASGMGKKTVIWEGNGYAGLTNKLLAKRVNIICTGFPEMEKVFPGDKVRFTGNPVRENLSNIRNKNESCKFFGLTPDKPVLFITGGSLGARSINIAIQQGLESLCEAGIQVIWQTGKNFQAETGGKPGILAMPFLREMEFAYGAADLVVSRSGALSMSEIAVCGKPALLVPSPNVTDDHQTQNALQFSKLGAALLIKDADVMDSLVDTAIETLHNQVLREKMREALAQLARPKATASIVSEIKNLITS
jgi:UDP-N-acetylglucosamine--N-acetylmuramyl-(pentapeptide) pyrophosphoryl-undecaprenol N-acetylglucosamine transferase